MTAAPTIGNIFPKIHDGIAINKHNPIPRAFFLKKFIHFFSESNIRRHNTINIFLFNNVYTDFLS